MTDKIAFSDAGFNLGLSGGATSTPQHLPSTLFSTQTDGTFDPGSPNERFAYDASSGQLFYGSHGSNSSVTLEVAVFSNHPTLSASDLYFVS